MNVLKDISIHTDRTVVLAKAKLEAGKIMNKPANVIAMDELKYQYSTENNIDDVSRECKRRAKELMQFFAEIKK